MPNKDGTGPKGKGPKTGRLKGNCEGAEATIRGPCGKGLQRGLGRRFENKSPNCENNA